MDSRRLTYCCPECPFTTPTTFHFRLHLAQHANFRHHLSPVRPSPAHPRCVVCGYLATGPRDLKRHTARHGSEARFICRGCGCDVSAADDFERHCRETHPFEGATLIDKKVIYKRLLHQKQEAVLMNPLVRLDPVRFDYDNKEECRNTNANNSENKNNKSKQPHGPFTPKSVQSSLSKAVSCLTKPKDVGNMVSTFLTETHNSPPTYVKKKASTFSLNRLSSAGKDIALSLKKTHVILKTCKLSQCPSASMSSSNKRDEITPCKFQRSEIEHFIHRNHGCHSS